MSKVKELKANSFKEAKELAKGYVWYTSSLFPEKALDGLKAHAKVKEALVIKIGETFSIYYK